MNSTEKGNKLEDKLVEYLCDQFDRDELVFDLYPANLCKVLKKQKYHCKDRGDDVEFDVVIEVRRKERLEPHVYVVFECKNHQKAVEEIYVRDFSDKLGSVFGQSVKGMIVTTSRLQSGADSVARNRGLGIVKFDENGIDVIADRKGGTWTETRFMQTQLFDTPQKPKALKFSALHEGELFGTVHQLLQSFETDQVDEDDKLGCWKAKSVPFLTDAKIQIVTQESLTCIQYAKGAVDLESLCREMSLELNFSNQTPHDLDGNPILGSAIFCNRLIEVNLHGNKHRERFTIAHEIGHFCLRHDQYLRSESIVERDLFVDVETDDNFNYDRLEHQANLFASKLLLPENHFRNAVDALRLQNHIYDKGFGYIFVDDQPCNYAPYNQLISDLSAYFEVSKQVIEIRLNGMGLLTDKRGKSQKGFFYSAIGKS